MAIVRVVSLVPSVTETLQAWGIEPLACTRFCEQPGLPTVGGTKNPDIGAIIDLRPDLVVMDEEENRREDHGALVEAGLAVHVTAVRDLADVGPTLEELAARIEVTTELVRLAPAQRGHGTLRAFVPIWRRPWMALGAPTYGNSLLTSLGVENVLADRGPYPEAGPSEATPLGAGAVIAPSEPYPFGPRHVPELAEVAPVVLVDGKDLFWWGVRTPGAQRRLADALEDARRSASCLPRRVQADTTSTTTRSHQGTAGRKTAGR